MSDVDPVVVERLIAGQVCPYATGAEREAAVVTMTRRNMSARTIGDRLRITTRSVHRHRANARSAA